VGTSPGKVFLNNQHKKKLILLIHIANTSIKDLEIFIPD